MIEIHEGPVWTIRHDRFTGTDWSEVEHASEASPLLTEPATRLVPVEFYGGHTMASEQLLVDAARLEDPGWLTVLGEVGGLVRWCWQHTEHGDRLTVVPLVQDPAPTAAPTEDQPRRTRRKPKDTEKTEALV